MLKIGLPHLEGEHEFAGLRFWDGDGVVRVLKADEENNAMLLEACSPGTPLRQLPEPDQDIVLAEGIGNLSRLRHSGVGGKEPGASFRGGKLQAQRCKVVISWRDLGSSRFRCDLAVRRPTDAVNRVAVLVDTDEHYRDATLDERYRLKPAVLRSFGWHVETVLALEWFKSREVVLRRIVAAVGSS